MDFSADERPLPASGLRLVPTGASERLEPITRVLLATDLSQASRSATNRALAIAGAEGAGLIVLSVVDPGVLRLPGGRYLRRIDQERSRVEDGARKIVDRARAVGIPATYLVWEGDPADAILEAAAAEGVDMVVMGSHGRGAIQRLLMGSVSRRVSDEATCQVLVVPS